jgi:hypothetical protein
MLILNPNRVKFGSLRFHSVLAVAIDRSASRELVEHSDLGPHAVFSDAPQQRTRIRVVQELTGTDLAEPGPGDSGELSFFASVGSSEARRVEVSAQCVVLRVEHDLRRTPTRTMTFEAVSADGQAEPIAIEDAAGGNI